VPEIIFNKKIEANKYEAVIKMKEMQLDEYILLYEKINNSGVLLFSSTVRFS
jgi:hypothetical protein